MRLVLFELGILAIIAKFAAPVLHRLYPKETLGETGARSRRCRPRIGKQILDSATTVSQSEALPNEPTLALLASETPVPRIGGGIKPTNSRCGIKSSAIFAFSISPGGRMYTYYY